MMLGQFFSTIARRARATVAAVAGLVLVASPLLAQAPTLYVVKKGDTLWGISERFINDPFYWPNLWAQNPFIRNPHFIYPGQRLLIRDGRIEILTDEDAIAQLLTPAEQPLPAVSESITIKAMGGGDAFIDSRGMDYVGTLVDTVDNRIMLGTGDRVFVELNNPAGVAPAERFSIVQQVRPVTHPHTNAPIGHFIREAGIARIDDLHEQVASATILRAFREIQRGYKLRPYTEKSREIELRQSEVALSGVILGAHEDNIAMAQNMVAFIDRGTADGLATGNMLIISRPRQATELARAQRGPWAEPLKLPESVLGAAVVIEAREHTAAILIIKSVDAIYRGDSIHTMMP